MLLNKTDAADAAGVSRRTFYNHIPKKHISVVIDDDGNEKIDLSELKRVYGAELVLKNLKKLQDAQKGMSNGVQDAQNYTPSDVQIKLLLTEQKLAHAQEIIKRVENEKAQIIEDKEKLQDQLDEAIKISIPLQNLLTDQRKTEEERKAIEEKMVAAEVKRIENEKKLKRYVKSRDEDQKTIKKLKTELQKEKQKSFWAKLFEQMG